MITASFLWRFLDDVWDLLPTEDRELFQQYWLGKLQIAGNLEQKAIETGLSTEAAEVPVFLTERWERFVMDETSCDLFTITDSLELVGVATTALSKETAFYHTLQVSSPTGQIYTTETEQFFDDSVRELRYQNLVPDTLAVKSATMVFTRNRDFVVNDTTGTIQALPNGRLPRDEVVTITYAHRYYVLDTDYAVDEVNHTVARTADSAIGTGDTVAVSYTYNNTTTIPMTSTTGITGFATLTDENKNFSTLLPNRTLTIAAGPNAGTYAINAVLSPTEIQVGTSFPSEQEEVSYSINAFPHGQRIFSTIASIPVLQDLLDEPTHVLLEDVDYVIQDGILSSNAAFRLSELGIEESRAAIMWAEEVLYDYETPYRNFGVLVDFYRANSEAYKLALQGLWFAFWTGSTPGNIERGLHILLGLPYARRAGTVTSVEDDTVQIIDSRGRTLSYTVPDGLEAVVSEGDEVARFASLSTGVTVLDRNNSPGFVADELGVHGIEQFLTSRASRGGSSTDDQRALDLLEHHLFMPRILVDVVQQTIDVNELVTFLNNIKPAWTQYVLAFASEGTDSFSMEDTEMESDWTIDLSANVTSNEHNQGISYEAYLHESASGGETLAGGTQATGNFQDTGANWTTLGVDAGDLVRILDGVHEGAWVVLKRISDTLLALDIPDADIAGSSGLAYEVIPEQRGLGHDAVQINREHIILPGTEYTAPASASLNTKTDADLLALEQPELVNLLLVDPSLAGDEVQAITDADPDLNEIQVATAPAVAVQDHEIASAALTRENSGGTITHAYAI